VGSGRRSRTYRPMIRLPIRTHIALLARTSLLGSLASALAVALTGCGPSLPELPELSANPVPVNSAPATVEAPVAPVTAPTQIATAKTDQVTTSNSTVIAAQTNTVTLPSTDTSERVSIEAVPQIDEVPEIVISALPPSGDENATVIFEESQISEQAPVLEQTALLEEAPLSVLTTPIFERADGTLRPEILHKANYNPFERDNGKTFKVLRTSAEYRDELGLHSIETPKPVDFARYQVLVSSIGQQPTGGYTINVEKLEELEDRVIATIIQVNPGPGCITTQAVTYPFEIILIESLKPVEIFERQRTDDC